MTVKTLCKVLEVKPQVYADDLVVTEKGGLKWLGDFEELQELIEGLEITNVKWSSPRCGCKLYESEKLSVS